MKTAMQELQDDLIQTFNDNNIPIILQIDKYLKKEKEQIENAYWASYKEGQYSGDKTAKEYYDETYNQDKITISETKRSVEGIGLNK